MNLIYNLKQNNPDILSCLANLSNDEVFTPPKLANEILDTLPQNLFSSPDTKFLDPACKSGVFLREIAKRLIKGLEPIIPDLQARLDHIFHKQLFGIAITELTGMISRRTLYCSKDASCEFSVSHFDDEQGNIRFNINSRHRFEKGKCVFCGASQANYESSDRETHAYEFIHTPKPERIFNMKFDVVISNPPYQMSDGGSAGGAMPIYQKFVEQAKKLNPKYICMIIPSRWFAGGRGLDEFREKMLNDITIKTIVDYPKSRECFEGVDIAGGVCYFLMERDHNGACNFTSIIGNQINTRERILNEFDIFIRYNIGVDIIHKIRKQTKKFMSSIMEAVSPFGLRSFVRGTEEAFDDSVTLISSAGRSYIKRSGIQKGKNLIDKYKVVIGYLNPDRAGVNNASDGKSNVTTKIAIYNPGEVITETYIILGSFDTIYEAKNCASYVATKFLRFLVFLTLSSMHITKLNFQFVPIQDFTKPWTDEELYAKYNLDAAEIAFIESMIKPMEI